MAGKKLKFESALSATKADVVEQSLGPIVPFPDWMTKTISHHLDGTGVVGLCGEPGTGKKLLLKQASSLPVKEYTIDRRLYVNHLSEFKRIFQQTIEGPCIWTVCPAELLTEDLVTAMVKHKGWQTKVVLISNEKIRGQDLRVVYHKVSHSFMKEVAKEIRATLDDVNACGCDLRQLQLTTMLARCGGIDKAPHVYFDTVNILNKKNRALLQYNKSWLEENVLASTDNLEQAAAFYANLAEVDAIGLSNEIEDSAMDNLQAQILKLSLPKKRQAPSKIECPHKVCSKAYSPQKWGYYPQARERAFKNYAAYMERESNKKPPPGPMNLTWNCQQRRLMLKENKSSEKALLRDDPLHVPVRQLMQPKPGQVGNSSSSGINPPAKKARTVAHPPPVVHEQSDENSSDWEAQARNRPRATVQVTTATDQVTSTGPGSAAPASAAEYDLLQGYGLYRTSLRTYDVPAGARSTEHYRPAPTDLKQAHWIRIEYPVNSPLDTLAKAFESNLPMVLYDMTANENATVVLVYKANQQNIRSNLTMGTTQPHKVEVANFVGSKGRAAAKKEQRKLVESFQQLPGKHVSNMYLGRKDDVPEYTAKSVYEEVKDMTSEEYTNYVLE